MDSLKKFLTDRRWKREVSENRYCNRSINGIVIPERFNRGSILKWIPAFAGMTLFFLFAFAHPAYASEWAKKDGYWAKTGGKLGFGLKYVVFSFAEPWLESNEPGYKREWEGFCAGIGKAVVYEAAGLIHLVTFPIPVDLPDVGIGLHVPTSDCPMRHHPNWKPTPKDSKKDLKAVPPPKAPKASVIASPEGAKFARKPA